MAGDQTPTLPSPASGGEKRPASGGGKRPASGGGEDLRASVCIPTRNRADILRQTLESLERQSVDPKRFEVVVGDDGSTDETIEMLAGFRSSFDLFWTPLEGRGSGAARNAAGRAARHEVLIFLDDDQITSPDLVAVHLETQRRDRPRGVSAGGRP
jgi:glycosyltransferase involved in cell wall biosynthesis